MSIKISVNKVGVGREANPYGLNPCKHWDAKKSDTYCAVDDHSCNCVLFDTFNHEHPPLPALDTKGNKLPVGEYEVELVWQYKCEPDCEFEWDGCSDNDPTHYIPHAETRQVYIASVDPESKEINEGDGMYHCNGCGKAMEDEDIAFANNDGYDYCADCYEAIQGDPESAAGLIEVPAIDEAVNPKEAAIKYCYMVDFSQYANNSLRLARDCYEAGYNDALSVNKQLEKEVDAIEQAAEIEGILNEHAFHIYTDEDDDLCIKITMSSAIEAVKEYANHIKSTHVPIEEVYAKFNLAISNIESYEITGDVEPDEDLYNQGLERAIKEINKIRSLIKPQ